MSTEAILTEWMSTSMADASYITKLGHVVENEQLVLINDKIESVFVIFECPKVQYCYSVDAIER